MPIDPETVRKVAQLARLELTQEELEIYGRQLGAIVEYVEQLQKLDVSGVEPLAHAADTTNVFRDDTPRPSLPPDAALQNAPDRSGDFFTVPKVVE